MGFKCGEHHKRHADVADEKSVPTNRHRHRLPTSRQSPLPLPGLLVDDAKDAYEKATANGGIGVLPPAQLADCEGGPGGSATISEVKLYGDVVLRFVSGDYKVRPQHEGLGFTGKAACMDEGRSSL